MAKFPEKMIEPEYRPDGARQMHDGEPRMFKLRHQFNDRSMRAHDWHICCECGFRHLFSYEVFYSDGYGYWVAVRAYADDSTRKSKKARRRRKK